MSRIPGTITSLLVLIMAGAACSSLVVSRAEPVPPVIQPVDGPGLKKALATYRGKVVVLNLWATWCAPCVEEFPDLVKLHNNFRAKGVTVVGAAMDEPEDRAKVVAFIGKQKASFPLYSRSAGSVDQFVDPLDKAWDGALPTTYVFDRNGKQVGKPLTGRQTYAQLAKALQPALK